MLREPFAGMLDDVTDGILIVETRYSHQDVHVLDLVDPHMDVFSES
jgi:hypothetical protein